MKSITCNQLGGACNLEFKVDSFEQAAELSKQHGMEMFQAGDKPHLDAMGKMQELMSSPDAMGKWFQEKKELFESLPELD